LHLPLSAPTSPQLQVIVDAVRHPGFDPSRVLKSAAVVSHLVHLAQAACGDTLGSSFSRILVPCADLVLPRGSATAPFVIAFDIAVQLSAVLRNPDISNKLRLTLDATGPEPLLLPDHAPVTAGSACFSKFGRHMITEMRGRHAKSRELVAPLLCTVQLDKACASKFGNIMLFPVVLLSLSRPFRYRKDAMITIAYLPVVCASEGDKDAARAGAATLHQRALTLGVVQPLQRLWETGFVVRDVSGFDC
jgi:hypothetical protein